MDRKKRKKKTNWRHRVPMRHFVVLNPVGGVESDPAHSSFPFVLLISHLHVGFFSFFLLLLSDFPVFCCGCPALPLLPLLPRSHPSHSSIPRSVSLTPWLSHCTSTCPGQYSTLDTHARRAHTTPPLPTIVILFFFLYLLFPQDPRLRAYTSLPFFFLLPSSYSSSSSSWN